MRIDSTIAKAAKTYVRGYLATGLDTKFEFHNLNHTEEVVEAVNTICNESAIDEHGRRILQVASWFHDLGYTERMENHEDVGAALAEKFLETHGADQSDIDMVKNCIIATHYPQHPLNNIEEMPWQGYVKYAVSIEWSGTTSVTQTTEQSGRSIRTFKP